MIPYNDARNAANLLIANLFESVMRCELAGTLRRIDSLLLAGGKKEDWYLKGIELVAIPNVGRERRIVEVRGKGKTTEVVEINFLRNRLEQIRYNPIWTEDCVRFYAPIPGAGGHVPCKLWLATVENFGAIWFIRTGPDAAVERVLRPIAEGGWLFDDSAVNENGLLRGNDEMVTLTEQQFFEYAFGRPVVPPHERAGMGT